MPKGIITKKQKEGQRVRLEREKLEYQAPEHKPWNESKNDPRIR